jgi:hypothetical protein
MAYVPLMQSTTTTTCPDRRTQHKGRTATVNPGNLTIHYDAELRHETCCARLLLCAVCREFDKDRSYLYVRENSIERNVASRCCCGGCCEHDHVIVDYFDRSPLKPETTCYLGNVCGIIPVCCCLSTEPKFEILKGGCLVCCCHCNECCCCEVR